MEDHILGELLAPGEMEAPIELQEMDLVSHRKDEPLKDLDRRMVQRTYRAGVTMPCGRVEGYGRSR